MATDELIASLAMAVDAAPEDEVLRRHLAELLVSADRGAEALEHVRVLLASAPDDAETLSLAAQAASSAGDEELAGRYRVLAESLDSRPSDPPSTPTVPTGSASEEAMFDAWGDELAYVDTSSELGQIFDVDRRPAIRLADVGGLADVKARLESGFLAPMRNEDLRKAYGKSLRGGLLLYGPPGCGKTYVARALAGELGARFLAVGLADILDMWLGNSEKNVREMFQTARRYAPCVLFLDELDAIGQKRTQLRNSAARGAVNQLLHEFDGVKDVNDGVFVLGATNSPWDVDPALRRPGRFDRTVLVVPPDREARLQILISNLAGRPHDTNLDLADLAKRTRGYSGADLAHLVESAAERAIARAIDSGNIDPIVGKDLVAALKEIRPSTRAWFDDAKNFVLFANSSGSYDDLLDYMKQEKLV